MEDSGLWSTQRTPRSSVVRGSAFSFVAFAAEREKLRTRGSERPSVATEKTLTSIDEGMAVLRTSRAQLLRVWQRLGMPRA